MGSATTTEAAQSIDPSDVVSVERYGARGDLASDDYGAIQRALDSGARGVRAKGTYLVNTTLQLAEGQVLFGLPKTNQVEAVTASTPRIKYRGSANTVAIKNANASLTKSCGVQDLMIDMNDNGSTAIQFATSYGNIARGIQFTGTMRLGLLSEDSYESSYENLSFFNASVRTACVFIGQSNNVTVDGVHTSGYPETVGECLYGIAMQQGNGNRISNSTFQGVTIGIATHVAQGLVIDNPYFENCLCPMRLGNFGSYQGMVAVNGGYIEAANVAHTQYASRGPLTILSCNTATFTAPIIASTAANGSGVGPWPFVVETCRYFTLVNPFHYNGADTTDTRDLIYRYAAGSNTGITIVGSKYLDGTTWGTEIVLKDAASYGATCAGLRVSGTTVSAVAYQPAVISGGAINSLLTTDLPTGASLVI
jgi:hypothetical protein